MGRKLSFNDCLKGLPKDSWFKKWLEVLPLAEPPKSFLTFGAMAMMGASLGRKCYMSQDFRNLWPMMNVLLIGPSGIGKSTSITLARDCLLNALPKADQPQFISGATAERLHGDLFVKPHAVLFASELANFFNKQDYNSGLVQYVTELLDYGPVERRTKSGGIVRVERPSVSVVGGSTVEWLQEQLPDSAVSGGFLARFLIVQENDKGQKIADPEAAMTEKQRAKLLKERQLVVDEFIHCVQAAEGGFKWADYGAQDAYTVWYSSHTPDTGFLSPFSARAGEFIRRMSMILAVSAHSPSIREQDVESALQLYEYCYSKLQDVVVPITPQGKLLNAVLNLLSDMELTEKEIFRGMSRITTAQEVTKLLTSLTSSGQIELVDGKFRKKKNA